MNRFISEANYKAGIKSNSHNACYLYIQEWAVKLNSHTSNTHTAYIKLYEMFTVQAINKAVLALLENKVITILNYRADRCDSPNSYGVKNTLKRKEFSILKGEYCPPF